MQQVRFFPEYCCSPIWFMNLEDTRSIFENTDISVLPVSDELKIKIAELDSIFQSTFNEAYPTEIKQLPDRKLLLFLKGIPEVVKALSEELPSDYEVLFDQNHWQKLQKLLKKGTQYDL